MQEKENHLPIIGGLFAAMGASLCCVGPLLLLILGVSGSWISHLTLLEPYQPILLVVVIMMFLWAGWNVYRPIHHCATKTPCATPHIRRQRQITFWIALIFALVLASSQYWIIWLV
jgi:mercuric ion transport protein